MVVDGLTVIRKYDVCIRVKRVVDHLKIIGSLWSSVAIGFTVFRNCDVCDRVQES